MTGKRSFMDRRAFGILAGAGVLAQGAKPVKAAPVLPSKLTPFGAERAGNRDGSIPAWTGGYSPESPHWKNVDQLPDYISEDRPILTIHAGNLSAHHQRLAPGVIAMIQNAGYRIMVYPTRRSHASPQYVYDNIALNLARAQLNPRRAVAGFSGGYGGIPFPVIDRANPLNGGAQLIWNYLTAYRAFSVTSYSETHVVIGGVTTLASANILHAKAPYYDPAGSVQTFRGWRYKVHIRLLAPTPQIGEEYLDWQSNAPEEMPDRTWILLTGEGRVRESPDIQFDTPSSLVDDVYNTDETLGFTGSPIEYDWRLLGKREVYIPYNNNEIEQHSAAELITPRFANPEFVRWELHRVWVVEARLNAAYRNVLPRRVFYFDEDTFQASIVDVFDADDNHVRTSALFNKIEPRVTGNVVAGQQIVNLRSGNFALANVSPRKSPNYFPPDFTVLPDDIFNPQALAATAAY